MLQKVSNFLNNSVLSHPGRVLAGAGVGLLWAHAIEKHLYCEYARGQL